MNVNVSNTSRNISSQIINIDNDYNVNQNLAQENNNNPSGERNVHNNSSSSHQSSLENNSILELNNNTNRNVREQQNHFRHGLTLDSFSERQIELNHIPQSLDNQFEREFTYNLPDNTSRQDPLEERNIKIDIYLHKNNKFTKRYNDRNESDVKYLNETKFKIPLEFNNNSDTLLPFIKIRKEIQQVIKEDISTND